MPISWRIKKKIIFKRGHANLRNSHCFFTQLGCYVATESFLQFLDAVLVVRSVFFVSVNWFWEDGWVLSQSDPAAPEGVTLIGSSLQVGIDNSAWWNLLRMSQASIQSKRTIFLLL
jgi:hypothetical protein